MRVAIIRTGLVLDPDHGLLKQLLPPFRLGVGGPIAGGRQYMPWIHVDDWVRLVLWALDTEDASGRLQRHAPNPVNQPRVLEGPRQSPGPPRRHAGPEAGAEGMSSAASWARSSPAASERFRGERSTPASSSPTPRSSRRSASCCAADQGTAGSGHPKQVVEHRAPGATR